MIKTETKKAKDFLNSVDLEFIQSTLQKINFTSREKRLITMMLDKKTIKEISIELNLSMSYIAALRQQIYNKISVYLQ